MQMVEMILAIDEAFVAAEITHAFGGALALAYAAQPRGTADIDVNVFVPPSEMRAVATALKPIGLRREPVTEELPIAGVRFRHPREPFPVDVFPSLDERYATIAARVVRHPFGPNNERLPFLSVEDLCIFKLSFARPQDWVDLGAIARANPDLDVEYIEDQLIGLRGRTMYPRVARLRGLLRG